MSNRVRFDGSQTLTDAQRAQARTNIAAGAASDVSELQTAMSTVEDAIEDATAAVSELQQQKEDR